MSLNGPKFLQWEKMQISFNIGDLCNLLTDKFLAMLFQCQHAKHSCQFSAYIIVTELNL